MQTLTRGICLRKLKIELLLFEFGINRSIVPERRVVI